jgi:hypothetical protein
MSQKRIVVFLEEKPPFFDLVQATKSVFCNFFILKKLQKTLLVA